MSEELTKDALNEIIDAYIFELRISNGLFLKRSELITKDNSLYLLSWDEKQFKHRPLLLGKGLNEVRQIYNSVPPLYNKYNLVEYTKIIEYVSQTVINRNKFEKIQMKLFDNRALNPDADYILELEECIISLNSFLYNKCSYIECIDSECIINLSYFIKVIQYQGGD